MKNAKKSKIYKSADYFYDKTVLVTGGTGTFGRAFIKKILTTKVKKVIVFSRDEYKQYEMRAIFPDSRLNFFLGDIRDSDRLKRAFNGVDVVIHAAALKQVPALEYNPLEAIKTNVYGTQNVIDAALEREVDKVLFISSDKAVFPVNLYGATKLCAERLIISANAYRGEKGKTKFSVIRYGNIIGSRGSLIELIEKQKESGVINLTDKRMTRFLISIDSVTDMIVSDIIPLMKGGEIFVPKMNSFKIEEVIKKLAPKCAINIIGIRPGEKLHEVLITDHEIPRTRELSNFFVILPEFINWKAEYEYDKKPSPKHETYASDHSDFILSLNEMNFLLKL